MSHNSLIIKLIDIHATYYDTALNTLDTYEVYRKFSECSFRIIQWRAPASFQIPRVDDKYYNAQPFQGIPSYMWL